jgi:hypothetical protein
MPSAQVIDGKPDDRAMVAVGEPGAYRFFMSLYERRGNGFALPRVSSGFQCIAPSRTFSEQAEATLDQLAEQLKAAGHDNAEAADTPDPVRRHGRGS